MTSLLWLVWSLQGDIEASFTTLPRHVAPLGLRDVDNVHWWHIDTPSREVFRDNLGHFWKMSDWRKHVQTPYWSKRKKPAIRITYSRLHKNGHHFSWRFHKEDSETLLFCWKFQGFTLRWRHNERDCVLNHQSYYCLLKHLFGRRSNKTSKLRVTGLCEGNSPETGEFPAQRASNAENVSIWHLK